MSDRFRAHGSVGRKHLSVQTYRGLHSVDGPRATGPLELGGPEPSTHVSQRHLRTRMCLPRGKKAAYVNSRCIYDSIAFYSCTQDIRHSTVYFHWILLYRIRSCRVTARAGRQGIRSQTLFGTSCRSAGPQTSPTARPSVG
jgi:hypothetical protein